MRAWFNQLDQREQISLLTLAFAVGLYLLYMLAWSPLAERSSRLERQNRLVATSLQEVDAMVSEIIRLRDGGVARNDRRNLTTLINRSTGRLELQVSRLQPNSRGELQVRLEGAAFDDLVAWLHEMEHLEGLLVREVSIIQAGTAGRVNATVRIAQAS